MNAGPVRTNNSIAMAMAMTVTLGIYNTWKYDINFISSMHKIIAFHTQKKERIGSNFNWKWIGGRFRAENESNKWIGAKIPNNDQTARKPNAWSSQIPYHIFDISFLHSQHHRLWQRTKIRWNQRKRGAQLLMLPRK